MPERAKRRPVLLKRAREAPSDSDGMRVLVDRLWPRGLSKEAVKADLWLRDVAPSDALRRWYSHDVRRWTLFRRKYRSELARRPEVLDLLNDLRRQAPVTLLFGARDAEHCHATVLREVLDEC
ncbi:MAG TPA: DUF488 family protein [Burkholderiales bacterium]|nr:DUF488 family protein [Burkholderiales bacterium]